MQSTIHFILDQHLTADHTDLSRHMSDPTPVEQQPVPCESTQAAASAGPAKRRKSNNFGPWSLKWLRHNSVEIVGVFKSKLIQNKTANRSKKTENRKKPNIFGCFWMLFRKNRYDRIELRIAFSNRTEPNRTAKVYFYTYLLFY
jgi:hypothetical protein